VAGGGDEAHPGGEFVVPLDLLPDEPRVGGEQRSVGRGDPRLRECRALHDDRDAGELREAARVVEMEVRGDDMGQVGWREAETADRLDRVGRLAAERAHPGGERTRIAQDVARHPGIDQDRCIAGLDQVAGYGDGEALAGRVGGRDDALIHLDLAVFEGVEAHNNSNDE
jgi:hypothetical protein